MHSSSHLLSRQLSSLPTLQYLATAPAVPKSVTLEPALFSWTDKSSQLGQAF